MELYTQACVDRRTIGQGIINKSSWQFSYRLGSGWALRWNWCAVCAARA